MSIKKVQLILLCEDKQHKSFVYRFLKKRGLQYINPRVKISPMGNGSGEQYVRKVFTQELNYYRKRTTNAVFIVMIDGDTVGVNGRIGQLKQECEKRNIQFRQEDEAVMIAVPTRNIETWIHFLDSNDVNEIKPYPKLPKERDCQPAVDKLVEICQNKEPVIGCPSLAAACEEYKLVFRK